MTFCRVVLCLSEFYFLNRSSAKQNASSYAELTCEHDKNKLTEYKDAVKDLEKKLVDLEARRAMLAPCYRSVLSLRQICLGFLRRLRLASFFLPLHVVMTVHTVVRCPTKCC